MPCLVIGSAENEVAIDCEAIICSLCSVLRTGVRPLQSQFLEEATRQLACTSSEVLNLSLMFGDPVV